MTDVELELVEREYHLLHELQRRDIPSVEPVGTCRSRFPTVHFFSSSLRAEPAERLLDALAPLLVSFHLIGYSWNDVSPSNTLFLRDAGSEVAECPSALNNPPSSPSEMDESVSALR